MQQPFEDDMAPLRTTPAEDSLCVNVWRPAGTKAGDRLPVLVWLYGGGFVNGGTSPAAYEGEALARQGIVFVSGNYRVGHFGFFAFPALSRADADSGLLANYGHMDQLAVLRWVHRHAAALGADAANLTLVGESAGGGSVLGLITSEHAAGLVRRAVVMSGGGRGLLGGNRDVAEDRPGLPSGHALGLRLARQHGIEGDGPAALAALRALPAQALGQGLNLATLHGGTHHFSGQMLDGRLLRDPGAAVAAGDWARIPLLLGTTEQEVGQAAGASKAQALGAFGSDAAAARDAYDPEGRMSLEALRSRVGMDFKMHEPARHLARQASAQGVPVWRYRFSYVAPSMRATWPDGAPHASEIPYFLGRLAGRYEGAIPSEQQRVADRALGYLANFARSGDPNGPVLPRWDRFAASDDTLLDVAADGECRMRQDPLRLRLDLVARHAAPR